MIRLTTLIACSFLLASPALASSYSARPATPPPTKRIVGKDIVWACGGGACTGSTDYGRPQLLCRNLARQAGKLESFSVDGRAVSGAELARCNGAAGGELSSTAAAAN